MVDEAGGDIEQIAEGMAETMADRDGTEVDSSKIRGALDNLKSEMGQSGKRGGDDYRQFKDEDEKDEVTKDTNSESKQEIDPLSKEIMEKLIEEAVQQYKEEYVTKERVIEAYNMPIDVTQSKMSNQGQFKIGFG